MSTTSSQKVTPQLRQWIVEQAQAGHGADAVLKAMLAAGWQEDVAVEAMEATLRGHLDHAAALIFSRSAYVPGWVDDNLVWIIPPSLDPFTAKNAEIVTKQAAITKAQGELATLEAGDRILCLCTNAENQA